ncbi:MAG: SulP family inorganic anion transporter [Candidatus Competibacterales bacterium]|nr:SulP family inorganic anion transporter [Candidatus Competibacterales bacterium]
MSASRPQRRIDRQNDRQGPGGWLPPLTIGVIAGIDNIGVGLAIASLLFAGPLLSGIGLGVGVVLLAAVVLALFIGLRSGQPNAIALVQESNVAVLAAIIAASVGTMVAPPEARLATALAIIGTSTLATAALLWVIGRLRLGGLVKLLPYPVVAGFVAASGWLLIEGALTILLGKPSLALLLNQHSETLVFRVLPAAVFALVLLVALTRLPGKYTAPAVLILSVVGFYVALALLQVDLEQARQLGLLPVAHGTDGVEFPDFELFAQIDWNRVLHAVPGMVAVAAISLIGVLLNTSGLELATGRELDTDHELRSTGIANLVAGSFGGPSGYVGLGVTLLAERIGARERSAGLATACVMLIGLAFAKPLVTHIPVFLTAGLVLYLGIELLLEWLVRTRHRLPTGEWLIVAFIVVVVAWFGFVTGLLAGLLVSVALFVYSYSRLPVVRLSKSGREQRSSLDRPPAARRRLADEGDSIEVVVLQGYLFFGTADRVVAHVRQRWEAADRKPLQFLVLDMRHVSGIDSAAVTGFLKIRNLAEANGFVVLLTQLNPTVRTRLELAGLDFGPDKPLRLVQDVEHALGLCEDALLAPQAAHDADTSPDGYFHRLFGAHPRLGECIRIMDRLEPQPGSVLIRTGDRVDNLFFIAHGRVRVQVTLPDGRPVRLRTMTSGGIVGEIALYLGQKGSADVIVEEPSVIFRLSEPRLRRLEQEDSELAVLFHRVLATALSEKLHIATRMIRAAHE